MNESVLQIEVPLRLGAGLLVFTVMAVSEMAAGSRVPRATRGRRWGANLALAGIDAAVVRLVLPAGLFGASLVVEKRGWGVLPALDAPPLIASVIAVVLLDLAIYLQHVLFHAVPGLWRFHRVHHADHDFDVTTGVRFHPVEILLSLAWKLVVIAAIGAPPEAVLAFEILLNASSLFNHANVSLPRGVDRALRWLVVTPDMHRIHHSVDAVEHDRNFGFNLTWWDRLLGTYIEPEVGRPHSRVGLDELPVPRLQGLPWLLALPWRRIHREDGRAPADAAQD